MIRGAAEPEIETALPRCVRRQGVEIYFGDVLEHYSSWPRPTVIVSDGPYGISGFPGDLRSAKELPDWYEPHVKAWSDMALPSTTLWFWGTELGWATVHPLLSEYGWEFRNCHIWNKGLGHVAGNANSKTLRKFPVVTEVCVQYVRDVRLPAPGLESPLPLKQWLRHEWERARLPLSRSNEACGVANAATRKYFTQDHLWYFPPASAFERLVDYANRYGDPDGRPYFSIDGIRPLTGSQWEAMRAKFHCVFGVNNVWTEPPVRNGERIRNGSKVVHLNQKPLSLISLIIRASSDEGDVVWEPFGGLCTAAIACLQLNRICRSAEILPRYYQLAAERLAKANAQ